VGYALAGLSIGNVGGLQSSLVYMLFYSATLMLLLSLLLGKAGNQPVTYVTDLNRLRSSPMAAVLATLTLFSLAGIPPLSGFWIKFFVLSELFNAKLYTLAVIGAFGSIFSSFYYVSLIKVLYFEEANSLTDSYNVGVPTPFLGILSFSLVSYPLFPGLIYELSGSFAISFFTEYF
jgi:NADH-quinone oxidoreductase subunit N